MYIKLLSLIGTKVIMDVSGDTIDGILTKVYESHVEVVETLRSRRRRYFVPMGEISYFSVSEEDYGKSD